MYVLVRKEIPEFLYDQVVYCDNFTYNKKYRTCFLLTKQLKFYEFHQKILLNSIDLKETVLKHIIERLNRYDGNKGKWLEMENRLEELSDQSPKQQPKTNGDIMFGKFFYLNLNIKKLYLLIQCWEYLIIVQRSDDGTTLQFIEEYDNVDKFKIVNSNVEFQSVVEIHLRDGKIIQTTFNETSSNAFKDIETKDMKELLQRVKCAKTEIQIQKKLTQNKLQLLQNTQMFGHNSQRSLRLEEKQKLSRFGDVWIRFPPTGTVCIGIPLVNNCRSPNLSILHNFMPILRGDVDDFSRKFQYRLYELKQNFFDFNTMETYFQCENVEKLTAGTWSCTPHLMPESFGVLVIRLDISQIICTKLCQLIIAYQVGFNKENIEQIFIKEFNFSRILAERSLCEISFNSETMHQDFLAIAATSVETSLIITFTSLTDMETFENLLMHKFDMNMISCNARGKVEGDDNQYTSISRNLNMDVEMDEFSEQSNHLSQVLYFNRNPSSLWYSTLILKQSPSTSTSSFHDAIAVFKFYTKSQELAFLSIKLCFEDLLLNKNNVKNIEYSNSNSKRFNNKFKVGELENALRLEIDALIKCHENKDANVNMLEEMEKIKMLQLQTDLLISAIDK